MQHERDPTPIVLITSLLVMMYLCLLNLLKNQEAFVMITVIVSTLVIISYWLKGYKFDLYTLPHFSTVVIWTVSTSILSYGVYRRYLYWLNVNSDQEMIHEYFNVCGCKI